MADIVREALKEMKLLTAYRDRPPYQLNDYIDWIARPRREETKQNRLA